MNIDLTNEDIERIATKLQSNIQEYALIKSYFESIENEVRKKIEFYNKDGFNPDLKSLLSELIDKERSNILAEAAKISANNLTKTEKKEALTKGMKNYLEENL